MLRFIGNIIWVVFGGFWWAVALCISAILCCCTIILIPVGIQLFKMARFVIWPFGKTVTQEKPNGIIKKIANFIWCVIFGWIYALGFLLNGALYCITIIGVPFGIQYFKLARFVLLPIGKSFVAA